MKLQPYNIPWTSNFLLENDYFPQTTIVEFLYQCNLISMQPDIYATLYLCNLISKTIDIPRVLQEENVKSLNTQVFTSNPSNPSDPDTK